MKRAKSSKLILSQPGLSLSGFKAVDDYGVLKRFLLAPNFAERSHFRHLHQQKKANFALLFCENIPASKIVLLWIIFPSATSEKINNFMLHIII